MIAFIVSALIPLTSSASAPAVPPIKQTPCYQQVVKVLKTDYNDFKIVDGNKFGTEFVDVSDFTKLPTREYIGMNGQFHFGLVGYARIAYHGEAVSHLYNYIVSAACVYDSESKKYVLDDENLDGRINKEDISLKSMDFER